MITDVGHLLPLPPAPVVEVAAPVATRPAKRGQHPFDEDLASEILDRISEGETLAAICRRRPDGLRPHHVYAWRMQHPVFGDQFAASRLGFADSLVDELLEVVRSNCFDRDSAAAAKVKSEALQWVASRVSRDVWGAAPDTLLAQEIVVNQILPDPASEVVPKALVWADTRRLTAEGKRKTLPISP